MYYPFQLLYGVYGSGSLFLSEDGSFHAGFSREKINGPMNINGSHELQLLRVCLVAGMSTKGRMLPASIWPSSVRQHGPSSPVRQLNVTAALSCKNRVPSESTTRHEPQQPSRKPYLRPRPCAQTEVQKQQTSPIILRSCPLQGVPSACTGSAPQYLLVSQRSSDVTSSSLFQYQCPFSKPRSTTSLVIREEQELSRHGRRDTLATVGWTAGLCRGADTHCD